MKNKFPKETCYASLMTTIYETYIFKGHDAGHSQILNEWRQDRICWNGTPKKW